jgi:diguanylate cyclase (GGDEF)-like protein
LSCAPLPPAEIWRAAIIAVGVDRGQDSLGPTFQAQAGGTLSAFARLLLPGAIVVAALAASSVESATIALAPYRVLLPGAVLVTGALLAAAFRRFRVFVALVALAAAGWALHRFAPGGGGTADAARYTLAVVALLLPLDLAAISLVPDRGAGRPWLLALIVAPPPYFAFAWLSYAEGPIRAVEKKFLPTVWGAWSTLPDPALLAFALASVLLLTQLLAKRSAFDAALFWVLVAAFAALSTTRAEAVALRITAAALVLVVALVQTVAAMAFRDPLTGLLGRRALDEALAALIGRYAIAVVDLDHFKAVNDTYGHEVGDQVLRMVASKTAAVGGGGRAFRCGGEEFAVLFPGRSAGEALTHLEELRRAVAEARFTLRGPDRPRQKPEQVKVGARPAQTLNVTISIGVAERADSALRPPAVMQAADRALYRAKRAGRNRVAR